MFDMAHISTKFTRQFESRAQNVRIRPATDDAMCIIKIPTELF